MIIYWKINFIRSLKMKQKTKKAAVKKTLSVPSFFLPARNTPPQTIPDVSGRGHAEKIFL
jgi:hypothetical protein